MIGGLYTGLRDKATSVFTRSASAISDIYNTEKWAYQEAMKSGTIGKGQYAGAVLGEMASSAGAVASRNKIATTGAVLGAGYGTVSDDTSVLGGAAIGAGVGALGAVGYGLAKQRFAGVK